MFNLKFIRSAIRARKKKATQRTKPIEYMVETHPSLPSESHNNLQLENKINFKHEIHYGETLDKFLRELPSHIDVRQRSRTMKAHQ